MRWLVAMMVSSGMVWAGAASEAGLGEAWQEAGKAEGAQERVAQAETVKPTAACGFCLEDGTKVPLR